METTLKPVMEKVDFYIGSTRVPYLLGAGCFSYLSKLDEDYSFDRLFVIADQLVYSLYREKTDQALINQPAHVLTITPGESSKNLATISLLAEELINKGCTRDSIIITLGGGVAGNIGGLVASLLFRGIRFIHAPTTFLAMHDSVTSAKQAVNLGGAKNMMGTYRLPTMILADTDFLQSLPHNQIISGKCELIKNALILGNDYFDKIIPIINENSISHLEAMIKSGIQAKSDLLKHDPFEKKEALKFEYGHTIGHALELYYEGKLTHGEAIAWGMYLAAIISNSLGIMPDAELNRHQQVISILALHRPAFSPVPSKLINLILKDNKRGYIPSNGNEIPMILLEKAGTIHVNGNDKMLVKVPVRLLEETIATFNFNSN